MRVRQRQLPPHGCDFPYRSVVDLFLNSLPGTLPLSPHTFQLQFSTLEDRVLDEAYCRIFVDQKHILHLEDWGDSAKLRPDIAADAASRNMT